MKAVLVDDEKLELDYLESLCKNIPVLTDIRCFTRSGKAYKWCEDNPVDIIILDVNMPDINGIALVTKLREIKPDIRMPLGFMRMVIFLNRSSRKPLQKR